MLDLANQIAVVKKRRASNIYPADSIYMVDTKALLDRIDELEAHIILANQRRRAEEDRRPKPAPDPPGVSAVDLIIGTDNTLEKK